MAAEMSHSASMPVISVSQPSHGNHPTHSVSTAHFPKIDEFPLPASKSQLGDWKEEDDGCDEAQDIDFTTEQEILKKPKKLQKIFQNSDTLQVDGSLTHGSSKSSMLDDAEMNEDDTINALDELDKEDMEDYTNQQQAVDSNN
ncbi:unnamed protein product [Bursaphelenchus okinawaensis]|uniref:Uncharacterized protein n=1 Tax=Bursaphelenchus okinawaensis TaxID=465554 RepID=A0A811LTE1_9BILA|nr:unnamed protein product [Bursaphelenchus okinawaensis]CAG9128239.1 unnamed protein product [Bursaphelenchus okinawaensis]